MSQEERPPGSEETRNEGIIVNAAIARQTEITPRPLLTADSPPRIRAVPPRHGRRRRRWRRAGRGVAGHPAAPGLPPRSRGRRRRKESGSAPASPPAAGERRRLA